MPGKHRADPNAARRRTLGVAAGLALLMTAPGVALAHNHGANPSGVCNKSDQGVSPGNSGETNLNPAGKPVAKAKAGADRSNCQR